MDETKTNIEAVNAAHRATLLFSAALEILLVGGLAIYAASNDYWQLVVVTLGYVAYTAFKLWYDLRKARSQTLANDDDVRIGEPRTGEPKVEMANWRNEIKVVKSTRRQRVLAGVLLLVYVALMALAFYLESIKIEDRWPVWLLWVGGVIGFAILLVLPFVVVALFFGIHGMFIPRRFTLRRMLRGMFWASLIFWYATQMHWIVQRQQWRIANGTALVATKGQAPPPLRLLNEQGESRIEIKNATKEKIAEAQRLFPEAIVVAAEESPDGE
jgi:hypothetical protein